MTLIPLILVFLQPLLGRAIETDLLFSERPSYRHKDLHPHLVSVLKLLLEHVDAENPEECLGLTFGDFDFQPLPYQMFHLTSNLSESARAFELKTCIFVITTSGQSLTDLLDYLPKNPNLILRFQDGQTKHPDVTLVEERLPRAHFIRNKERFVYSSYCRKPRIAVYSPSSDKLIFNVPEEIVMCYFRVGYNKVESIFELLTKDKADINSREGYLIETFLERKKMKPKYINANKMWGTYDPVTDTWNGLVNMALQDEIDLGVGYIAVTSQRNQVIDYANTLVWSADHFISKYPGYASPFSNLIRVFDGLAWTSILISTLIPCIVIYIFMRFIDKRDARFDLLDIVMNCNFIIVNCPDWYVQKAKWSKKSFMLFMGIFLLAVTVLSKAFSCNLNAILLKPVELPPVDTACDIYNRQITYVLDVGSYHLNFLKTSGGACRAESVENVRLIETKDYEELMYMIANDPNLVMIDGKEVLWATTVRNPLFEALPKPWFHVSKEELLPYFNGWIIKQKSVWSDPLDHHTQLCSQAGLMLHIDRMYLQFTEVVWGSTRSMTLEHVLIGFYLLFVGCGISATAFFLELLYSKKSLSTNKFVAKSWTN